MLGVFDALLTLAKSLLSLHLTTMSTVGAGQEEERVLEEIDLSGMDKRT